MGQCSSTHANKLGVGPSADSKVAFDDGRGLVHYLVTRSKQPNYLRYACDPTVCADDPVAVINRYTEHESDLYQRVNLGLASDSSALEAHGEFIKQLRHSVLSMPLVSHTPLFRGVDMSEIELHQMESLGRFFIPSFTSTSISPDKAYAKNTTIVVHHTFGTLYGCTVTPELSPHAASEEEVLLPCYSAYDLERIERCNGKNVVTLSLNDHFSVFRDI